MLGSLPLMDQHDSVIAYEEPNCENHEPWTVGCFHCRNGAVGSSFGSFGHPGGGPADLRRPSRARPWRPPKHPLAGERGQRHLPGLLRRSAGPYPDARPPGVAGGPCSSAASRSRCARPHGSRSSPACIPSRAARPSTCARKGKIPSWLKGFPAYLRKAGYYTSNNAKTDYNAPINMKEAWDASGRNAHWRKRPDPQQPFFSVFNHEVTHESCLFPVEERKLDFPAYGSGPGAHPALPAGHTGNPRRLGQVLQPHDTDGRADRRQAQGPGEGRAGGQHHRLLLLRQWRRASAQQAIPGAQRHPRPAHHLFPTQVAAPGPGAARLPHQGPRGLRGLRTDRSLAGGCEHSRLHDGARLCRPGQGPAERATPSARATAWTSATT